MIEKKIVNLERIYSLQSSLLFLIWDYLDKQSMCEILEPIYVSKTPLLKLTARVNYPATSLRSDHGAFSAIYDKN